MFGASLQEERSFHSALARSILWISVPVFVILYWIVPSPWGKTSISETTETGPSSWRQRLMRSSIPAPWAWFLFEGPNLLWSIAFLFQTIYFEYNRVVPRANYILFGMFVFHYLYRALVYPLLLSNQSKPMPLAVVLSATAFCICNGYLQVRGRLTLETYPLQWETSPWFGFGVALFLFGFVIHVQSDHTLRRLRRTKPNLTYQIPIGGGFDYVSTPHFAGEIVEWIGYSIACHGSIASVAFATFTIANLLPRGVAHHQWYRHSFDHYPRNRKAVIPFVW